VGCDREDCFLTELDRFLKQKSCPRRECGLAASQMVPNRQQKMVDTMLVADLVFLAAEARASPTETASPPRTHLVVVSSDVDMWPGVATALGLGSSVVLVQTEPGATFEEQWGRERPSGLVECGLLGEAGMRGRRRHSPTATG
jgi:hypothetical protein